MAGEEVYIGAGPSRGEEMKARILPVADFLLRMLKCRE
jgi:hypothetical protein